MAINPMAPILALAVLALTPGALVIAQTSTPGIHGLAPMPTQEQLLMARVTTLESEVTQLTADVKALKVHTHTYSHPKNATMYMSIHDLSVAMQPHSATPDHAVLHPDVPLAGKPARRQRAPKHDVVAGHPAVTRAIAADLGSQEPRRCRGDASALRRGSSGADNHDIGPLLVFARS